MSSTLQILDQDKLCKETPSSSDIEINQTLTQDELPPKRNLFQKTRDVIYPIFLRYWFLLGLGIVIGLAWAFPQVGKSRGDIQAQYTVKWGAVIVIFLLSGLGLEVSVMLKTIMRWRLHLVVQVINFGLMPFVMYGIVRFFIAVHADLGHSVYKGWMIALSTSTTVSSNSIMTRNASGNDGAGKKRRIKKKWGQILIVILLCTALFNAALGNVLGIFISPALMTGKIVKYQPFD